MKKYSFKDVSNVLLFGDIHCNLKSHLNFIKQGLFVKDEDVDKPHPKELEMNARREARRNARNAERMHEFLRQGGMGIHFDAPQPAYGRAEVLNTSNTAVKRKKKPSTPFSNTMFIFTGDNGIGLNSPEFYNEIFEKLNKVLQYNNTYIIFIRGNYDDPSYFDGERIDYSNIKAVPDYSVIETKDRNILCVGGAISMDRTWKINQEKRINSFSRKTAKKLYWENEAPVYDEDALKYILKDTKIDVIVTHSAPSFVMPESCLSIDSWGKEDTNLISDVNKERIVFDKIFNTIRELRETPTYWAYSHFDYGHIERRAGTIFRSLAGGQFDTVSIGHDISSYVNAESYEKMKKHIKKTFYKLSDGNVHPVDHFNEEPDANEFADEMHENEDGDLRDEPEEELVRDDAERDEPVVEQGLDFEVAGARATLNGRNGLFVDNGVTAQAVETLGHLADNALTMDNNELDRHWYTTINTDTIARLREDTNRRWIESLRAEAVDLYEPVFTNNILDNTIANDGGTEQRQE